MHTFKKLVAGLAITVFAPAIFADNCEYERKIERSVDLKGAKQIAVEAGAGSLAIFGEQGRNDVMINAKLCAPEKEQLDKMDVLFRVNSDSAVFETHYAYETNKHHKYSASIDLELRVPSSSILDVADSSGAATVKNVQQLKMIDSSGELKIENIAGNLIVKDSSGEMTIKSIKGDVEVTDSSGGIYIKDVGQSVLIHADSSGCIEVKNVTKDVMVKRDSSGGIEVKDVGGDFTVEKDSSGGIRYKNVAGKVSLPQ